MGNNLSASLEDYLETIFHIVKKKQVARSKDIAKNMHVSTPSVTAALQALSDRGLVNYAPYEVITLTNEGEELAMDVIRRHETLRNFFIDILSIDAEQSDEAACKMEHSIPPVILEKIIKFAEFTKLCPRGGDEWLAGFKYYCEHHQECKTDCSQCISKTFDDIDKNK